MSEWSRVAEDAVDRTGNRVGPVRRHVRLVPASFRVEPALGTAREPE